MAGLLDKIWPWSKLREADRLLRREAEFSSLVIDVLSRHATDGRWIRFGYKLYRMLPNRTDEFQR